MAIDVLDAMRRQATRHFESLQALAMLFLCLIAGLFLV